MGNFVSKRRIALYEETGELTLDLPKPHRHKPRWSSLFKRRRFKKVQEEQVRAQLDAEEMKDVDGKFGDNQRLGHHENLVYKDGRAHEEDCDIYETFSTLGEHLCRPHDQQATRDDSATFDETVCLLSIPSLPQRKMAPLDERVVNAGDASNQIDNIFKESDTYVSECESNRCSVGTNKQDDSVFNVNQSNANEVRQRHCYLVEKVKDAPYFGSNVIRRSLLGANNYQQPLVGNEQKSSEHSWDSEGEFRSVGQDRQPGIMAQRTPDGNGVIRANKGQVEGREKVGSVAGIADDTPYYHKLFPRTSLQPVAQQEQRRQAVDEGEMERRSSEDTAETGSKWSQSEEEEAVIERSTSEDIKETRDVEWHFWVSQHHTHVFREFQDRRVISIGRLSRCDVELTNLTRLSVCGDVEYKVIIKGSNYTQVSKCKYMFLDKFPDFRVNSGFLQTKQFST